MRITLSESALRDMEQILEYYETENIQEIGQRFISEIFSKIELLSDHPKLGRLVPEFNNENIRELIHPPFRVVYRYHKKTIKIIRVWRSERLLELPTGE